MKNLRILLIILFTAVFAAYLATFLKEKLSDNTPPAISADKTTIEVSVHDGEESLFSGMTASDKQDGDLTSAIRISGISKLISNDTAKVTYIVFDSDENIATYTRYVKYTDYIRPRFSLREPLTYQKGQDVTLTNRLFASDVLDGDLTNAIKVSALDLTITTEGLYSITVQVTNSLGDTSVLQLPVIITSDDPNIPEIGLTEYLVYLNQGEEFDPEAMITSLSVSDEKIEDLSGIRIESDVDTSVSGAYTVKYSYTSLSDKTGTVILTVVVL